jgi:hypothetical protein
VIPIECNFSLVIGFFGRILTACFTIIGHVEPNKWLFVREHGVHAGPKDYFVVVVVVVVVICG